MLVSTRIPTLSVWMSLTKLGTVLYYSNAILSKALPDLGPFISLGITIVNVIMTFPPIFLIEVSNDPLTLLLYKRYPHCTRTYP